jgi:hypothetical protein
MRKIKINISKDFSPTPGPRYINEGNYSGELFRREILFNRVSEALENDIPFEVNLDGTAGYGTSFLEESFGGLIRIHKLSYEKIIQNMILISDEEEYLIDDIKGYLYDAANEENKE